uniref:Uncharacterized protein n=1 Tax=Romanomermis culicivorax TaxID=13658 RepID=A0A915KMU6_ROMCU
MVIGHNKYQGLCCNGWQGMPILTSALLERPPVLRSMTLPLVPNRQQGAQQDEHKSIKWASALKGDKIKQDSIGKEKSQ